MAKLLKLRRGTTTQHGSFTGAEGEVTIDTTKDTAVVHDGSTAGGTPLAKEDMSNVSSSSIAGRLGADSIATTKIAGGALPTDVTVATANIVATGVSAGTVGSSTAIPIITVNNKGQVTNTSTTPVDATKIENGSAKVQVASNGPITSTGNHDFTAGIDVTGNITVSGTVDGRDVASDGSKLDGIESGATADQTAAEIRTLVEAASNSNVFTDADHSKLNGIESGATADQSNSEIKTAYEANSNTNAFTDALLSKLNGVAASATNVTNNNQITNGAGYITAAQVFPSGTKMLFQQTSAPTGWTKVTSHNNKALRVVSGSASSGGSNAFTSAFAARGISANASNTTAGGNVSVSVANATQGGNVSIGNTTAGGNVSISSVSTSGSVNSHTLSVNEIPSHTHSTRVGGHNQRSRANANPAVLAPPSNSSIAARSGSKYFSTGDFATNATGGGGGHSHGFSGSSHNHNGSLSGTAHNHNASFSGSAHSHNASGSFSGSAHNHSISVGNLDMAVQYVDVIIASKN